jgi:hypothetical protein
MGERKAFLLRIDSSVCAALARWADEEMRSLNGQIEFLLQRDLAEARRMPASPGARGSASAAAQAAPRRPAAREPAASGVRRRLPTSVSTPPSGIPAQGRLPTSVSTPPSGIPAPGRLPTSVAAPPRPAAPKPEVGSPLVRAREDDWDAMVD